MAGGKEQVTEQANTNCFVISPIGHAGSDTRKAADMVLHNIIRPAFADNFLGYTRVYRADEIADPGMINDRVIQAILNDRLAVADLTDLNPNVFYEIGLRHLLNDKPIIHIAREGTKIPFDTAGQNTIFYDIADVHSHNRASDRIREVAVAIEAPDFKISNPVTQSRATFELSQHADSTSVMLANVLKRLDRLEDFRRPPIVGPAPERTLEEALRDVFRVSDAEAEVEAYVIVRGYLLDQISQREAADKLRRLKTESGKEIGPFYKHYLLNALADWIGDAEVKDAIRNF